VNEGKDLDIDKGAHIDAVTTQIKRETSKDSAEQTHQSRIEG